MSAPFWIERSRVFARVDARGAFRVLGVGEKRLPARAYPRHPGGAQEGLHIETLGVDEMDAHGDAWRALAARTLEPNIFFEPGFALALARHAPVKSRPRFVAVWREGAEPRLVGLFPMAPEGVSIGGLARLWLDKQAALAAPLLDPDFAGAALRAYFAYTRRMRPGAAIVFPRLIAGGATHKAILAAARDTGRQTATLESYLRAALYRGAEADALARRGAGLHAVKELHRRRRRLEEQGVVAFSLLSEPREIRAAVEDFLALEAAGWKGARGALLKDPALSAFARSATRLLAREGKCRIARLALDGRPLALGVVFESGDRAFFWKIAFDESFRASAPGIDLVYELTRRLTERSDIAVTDSCAIANHPMIDRFWPDRLPICDLAVELDPARPSVFYWVCEMEGFRRTSRESVKRLVNRLLHRKIC
jgi:CelD/BcsL family acetyltransferase involved in cellulose biosynthesis